MKNTQKGFTLIEILVVIGMIAILATIVLIAINPARQFAQSRNSQRQSNVNAILNAISQRMVDNKGIFETGCDAGVITTAVDGSGVPIPAVISKGGYNIRPCLVPLYISELPFDPADGSNTCASAACDGSGESYDTKYTVHQDATTKRITVCAPNATGETAIQPTPSTICVSR